MAVVYIDEYGCQVSIHNGLLNIKRNNEVVHEVRIQEIEYVVLVENCNITSAVLSNLLYNGVKMCVLSYNGDYIGKLDPVDSKNILIRKQQYNCSDNDAISLAFAKRFVAAKIANMKTILMRYNRANKESYLPFDPEKLKEYARTAGSVDTYDQLLGIEGIATKHYFQCFSSILNPPFVFNGRNRRPPKDAVNAMLSFSYALLENALERSIGLTSLDPYCGFFHKDVYGRQSLVLDLMEEMRPVIADSVVITCCNKSIIELDRDFENRNGGVYLNESGRKRFFKAFYTRMKQKIKLDDKVGEIDYQKLCDMQAYKLAKCIKENTIDYKPYLIK